MGQRPAGQKGKIGKEFNRQMIFTHPKLEIRLKDCPHWFEMKAATGKTYFPAFVEKHGITGIRVFHVTDRAGFEQAKELLARDPEVIVFFDEAFLYMKDEDYEIFEEYKDRCLLVDIKVMIPSPLSEVGKMARIVLTRDKITITDDQS